MLRARTESGIRQHGGRKKEARWASEVRHPAENNSCGMAPAEAGYMQATPPVLLKQYLMKLSVTH